MTLTLPQFSSEVTVTTANRREQLLLDVAEPTVLFDAGQIADTGARTAKDLLIEQQGAGIQVHPGGGQGHLVDQRHPEQRRARARRWPPLSRQGRERQTSTSKTCC